MRSINIAIIVNSENALSSGSLQSNVYLVDTNKYLGSWGQGESKLHTVCQDGQSISWWATAVNAANAISISGFSGEMVSSKTCVPQLDAISSDNAWFGNVQTHKSIGSFSYTITLDLDGKAMSFMATLKVV